jgi:hypothetical protein
VTTFGSWFEAQAGRGDDIGRAAKAWKTAGQEGKRPRASSVPTITRFLQADPDRVDGVAADQLEQVLVAAATEYRRGNHQAGPAVPNPPTASVTEIPGMPVAPAIPPPGAETGSPVFAQLTALFTMLQSIRGQLGDLQGAVGAQSELLGYLLSWAEQHAAALAPLLRLVSAVDEAVPAGPGPETADLASQLGVNGQQPGQGADAGLPPGLSYDPASGQISGVPTRPGLYGIQVPGPAAFYGPHVVPEPDWAGLAALGEPGQAEEDQPWRSSGEMPGG